MRYTIVVLAVLLAGCFRHVVERAEPVDVFCAPECAIPCQTTPPAWEPANPHDPMAWDNLIEGVLLPTVAQLEACEIAREACVMCLDRARDRGAIR